MSPSAVDNAQPAVSAPTAAVKSSIGGADVGIVDTPKVSGDWTVEKVLDKIPGGRPTEGSDSPLPFFHMLERLKTTKREGWRRFGISRGESISDHMYRMSMISMFAPPSLAKQLDLQKCMKMCLIHDMAEALVGDITPVDHVPKPEKCRREATTMDYFTRNLLGGVYSGSGEAVAQEMRAIWQEYEDSETLESKYVHDIDKIELLLQMVEYEKRGEHRIDLGEFAHVATRVELEATKKWADDLLAERRAFWGERPHKRGNEGIEGGVQQATLNQQAAYYSQDRERQ